MMKIIGCKPLYFWDLCILFFYSLEKNNDGDKNTHTSSLVCIAYLSIGSFSFLWSGIGYLLVYLGRITHPLYLSFDATKMFGFN